MTAKIIDIKTKSELNAEQIKKDEDYQAFIQSYLETLSPEKRQAFHEMQK